MSKKYVVEGIDGRRTEFGDSLDNFCDGSIKDRDSRILLENGFVNIGWARNPMDWIHELGETVRNLRMREWRNDRVSDEVGNICIYQHFPGLPQHI